MPSPDSKVSSTRPLTLHDSLRLSDLGRPSPSEASCEQCDAEVSPNLLDVSSSRRPRRTLCEPNHTESPIMDRQYLRREGLPPSLRACKNDPGVLMATFGSFCLLIALALAAYNLLAGALALRLIATGQPARISPERLADTARRAGIAGFWAITGAAFALHLVGLYQRLLHHLHPRALQPRAAHPVQICGAVERPGRFAAALGVAAGHVWLCAAAAA